MAMVKQFTEEARGVVGLDARTQRELACTRVYEAMVSNEGVQRKSALVVHLLATLLEMQARLPQPEEPAQCPTVDLDTVAPSVGTVRPVLRALEELRGQPYSKVALEARQLVMRVMTPSIEKRQQVLHSKLRGITGEWVASRDTPVVKGYKQFAHLLQPLVQSVTSVFEELSVFLQPQNPTAVRFASLELFIRRSHRQYTVSSLSIKEVSDRVLVGELWFQRQSVLGSSGSATSSSDNLVAKEVDGGSSGSLERNGSPKNGPLALRRRKPVRRSGDAAVGRVEGNFTDSILDMQDFVREWERGNTTVIQLQYPLRYSVVVVCQSAEVLEASFAQVVGEHFKPVHCPPNTEPSSPVHAAAPRPETFPSPSGEQCEVSNAPRRSSVAEEDDMGSDSTPLVATGDEAPAVHVRSIVLCSGGKEKGDVSMCERVGALLQQHKTMLRSLQICRVTLILLRESGYPDFYTFRDRLDYHEDAIYRHLNPPRAFMIEIGRLGVHYDIQPVTDDPILNRHVRTFLAKQKRQGGPTAQPNRFFVRSLVLGRALADAEDSRAFLKLDLDKMLGECCESLALSRGAVEKQTGKGVAYNRFGTLQMCNHFFLSVVPHLLMTREEAVEALRGVVESNVKRLRQAGVIEVEIPFTIEEPDLQAEADDLPRLGSNQELEEPAGAAASPRLPPLRMRVVFRNPSGHNVETDVYMEVFTSTHDMKLSKATFRSIHAPGKAPGALDGRDLTTPYPPIDQLELRRLMAKGKETTYCYDFLSLFDIALRKSWQAHRAQVAAQGGMGSWIARQTGIFSQQGAKPEVHFKAKELVLCSGDTALEEVTRAPGLNDIGMVAWRVWMKTPECPEGRSIVLIGNDVTVQNGSFGVREDQLFLLATELAQREGLPRVYIAANTGARIGLVDEVKSKFRVQWKDPLNPTSGMEFLYLDDTEVDVLRKNDMVRTELVSASDGTQRHRITAVIGPDGIGVENLRGAGKIAGSTCRAYKDIFTLTFVSGTSVGIGAYLVRLGQRAIQKGPPILLTGEAALNKVLGKKVYTSNYQLGGTQIMYNNGVSHEVPCPDHAPPPRQHAPARSAQRPAVSASNSASEERHQTLK